MNKFAKGSLAAGAGIVLLLGGAGTLAYWNSEDDLTGGAINAGTLELKADQEALDLSSADQPELWVPGDEHTYSTVLRLETSGDNIQGEVELNKSSITVNGAGAEEFDVAMSVTGEKTPEEGDIDFNEATGKITFDGPGPYTIPVHVTVTLPFGKATNNSQGVSADWSKVSFIATQTPAAGAVGQ